MCHQQTYRLGNHCLHLDHSKGAYPRLKLEHAALFQCYISEALSHSDSRTDLPCGCNIVLVAVYKFRQWLPIITLDLLHWILETYCQSS